MDKHALKTLFNTYWSSKGWKDERQRKVSHEDFAYAKAAGVMFDPIRAEHEAVLKRLFTARDALKSRQVANAFLASLSTRRLDLRSALGSFAVFRHLTAHTVIRFEGQCRICGQYLPAAKAEDINVLNFERFKWGGVRHDDPLYAMLDLELCLGNEQVDPTPEDISIFKNLIAEIETAPAHTKAATLQGRWTNLLKSNKDERNIVIAVLGFCGILETADHKGYRNRFIPVEERELPGHRFVDMAYPACWWSRADGISTDALHEWFGHVV